MLMIVVHQGSLRLEAFKVLREKDKHGEGNFSMNAKVRGRGPREAHI